MLTIALNWNYCRAMKTIVAIFLFFVGFKEAKCNEIGLASWYGRENKISSTGKKIQHNTPALAHKSLPLGCFVRITNLKTNDMVIARVEDRGPYVKGRIADVNIAAARVLKMQVSGIIRVKIERTNLSK